MSASRATNKTKEAKPDIMEPQPVQAVAKRVVGAAPALFADDIDEFSGAGTSTRREDNIVPFLYIAQKNSPQVEKRDPAYIPGLEPGMIFDTSTRQFWDAENGAGPVLVQAHFVPAEVEWGLRSTPTAGFKGQHPVDTALLAQITEKPKETGRGTLRMLPNGNQLVTTRYHYMILADDLRPVAVACSSTATTPSKNLNTTLLNKKVRNSRGQLVSAPSFASLIRMRTVYQENDAGSWWSPVFEDLGWITEDYMDAYNEAKTLYRSAMAGGLRMAEPEEDGTISGVATPGADDGDPGANPDDDPTHENHI